MRLATATGEITGERQESEGEIERERERKKTSRTRIDSTNGRRAKSHSRHTRDRFSWLRSSSKAEVDRVRVDRSLSFSLFFSGLLVSFWRRSYTPTPPPLDSLSCTFGSNHRRQTRISRARAMYSPGKKCYCFRWPTYGEVCPFRKCPTSISSTVE